MNYHLKLKIGVMTLFLSYASLCYAGDFRKAYFGMSFGEIKALEPNFTYSAEDQMLYGVVGLAGLKAVAGYMFVNGIFVEGRYAIAQQYKNPEVWMDTFVSLESLLIAKYGTPDENRVKNWSNAFSQYKDKKEQWGQAIQKGHLSITSKWENKNKIVTLDIRGSGHNMISLKIYYSSLKFKDLMEKRTLKDL